MPQALGLSFGLSIILFCLYHSWLEWKEAGETYEPDHKASGVPGRDKLSQEELAQKVGVRRGDHWESGKREVQPLPQAGHGHCQCVRLYGGGAVSISLTERRRKPTPHTK